MISGDIIPMMPKVKVAIRMFGPLEISYRRHADCVLTSLFRRPRYPHPYWAPRYCSCNREMGQILAPRWPTTFKTCRSKHFSK